MAVEESYIIAGTFIWILIFLLTAFLMMRHRRERRMRRTILQAEVRDAEDVARLFAAIDPTHSQSDSFASIQVEDRNVNHSDSDVLQRQRGLHVINASRNLGRPERVAVEMQGYMLRDGLTKEEINSYAPVSLHRKGDVRASSDSYQSVSETQTSAAADSLTCAVCLDNIEVQSRKRVLPCEHSFHARCVQLWLQRANRCPCCIAPVVEKNNVVPRSATDERGGGFSLPFSSNAVTSSRVEGGSRRRMNGSRFLGLWTFGRGSESRRVDLAMSNETIVSDERHVEVENSISTEERYVRSTDDRYIDRQEAGSSALRVAATLRALHRSMGIDSMENGLNSATGVLS